MILHKTILRNFFLLLILGWYIQILRSSNFLLLGDKEKDPWEMNKHERIQVSQRKKEEGNLLFKNGKYQRAMKKYEKVSQWIGHQCLEYATFHETLYYLYAFFFWIFFIQAVDYINEDRTFEDDDQRLVKSLRVSCWLNGAACCLKQNDFQEAIKLCSKVMYLGNRTTLFSCNLDG